MLTMRVENAIETMVEAMLPRFSGDLGLELTLDLSCRFYVEEEDESKEFRREVKLLFVRQFNYTRVFARVTDMCKPRKLMSQTEEWKAIADHDSAWVSGISSLLFSLVKEKEAWLDSTLPTEKRKQEYYPLDYSFSIFSKPQYHKVEAELLPGQDKFGGMYSVTLKPLTQKEATWKMK